MSETAPATSQQNELVPPAKEPSTNVTVNVNLSAPGSAPQAQQNDFYQQAEEAQPSLVAEFLDFLVHNKAWWLTPIIIVLLLVGLLVIFGGTAAAPFIYTIF